MAARTLKELIASTGGRLILAGAGAVVALSERVLQCPTCLPGMDAWAKWIITGLASFGLVVVARTAFYSLLASVAMLSTIVLAAASLAEARSQTDYARQLVEATRRQSRAIETANEVFGNLKSILGEMDEKGILAMAGQVRSLQNDLARRLWWVLVALGVIAVGVAVAVLFHGGSLLPLR